MASTATVGWPFSARNSEMAVVCTAHVRPCNKPQYCTIAVGNKYLRAAPVGNHSGPWCEFATRTNSSTKSANSSMHSILNSDYCLAYPVCRQTEQPRLFSRNHVVWELVNGACRSRGSTCIGGYRERGTSIQKIKTLQFANTLEPRSQRKPLHVFRLSKYWSRS